MKQLTHINVTIDFSKWGEGIYDLRIPVQQTVKALIINLVETLKLHDSALETFTIKARNKDLLLADDDRLIDFPITDGDILEIY